MWCWLDWRRRKREEGKFLGMWVKEVRVEIGQGKGKGIEGKGTGISEEKKRIKVKKRLDSGHGPFWSMPKSVIGILKEIWAWGGYGKLSSKD